MTDMLALKRAAALRDKACVAAVLGFAHVCRDSMGTPHAPTALERMSLEHVKEHLWMGGGRVHDLDHVVVVCYAINLRPPTKEMKAAFRAYLKERKEARHAPR